ncbi:MAG: hypothetical protein EHM24_18335 [Acidobacteria bacterium]|nr:MAG: hypothetical protein EHM24_18335 [Acidobacteriota bacterium]
MARGWESKSIESQQEEAAARQRKPERPPTPEEIAQRTRRRTLELARARAASDLARARTASHREMLERALASLDEQLTAE